MLSQSVYAAEFETNNREKVLSHLKTAFDAQTSLSEKPRERDEMVSILSTHFDSKLINQYLVENTSEEAGKFIVYGTDFPVHVIPFFNYDENTKIIDGKEQIIVYEYFTASSDGPVSYDDHYEWVKLKNTQHGLKIMEIVNYAKELEGGNHSRDNIKEGQKTSTVNTLYVKTKENDLIYENDKKTKTGDPPSLNNVFIPYFYFQTKSILQDYFYEKFI